jgi:hypothetical protein
VRVDGKLVTDLDANDVEGVSQQVQARLRHRGAEVLMPCGGSAPLLPASVRQSVPSRAGVVGPAGDRCLRATAAIDHRLRVSATVREALNTPERRSIAVDARQWRSWLRRGDASPGRECRKHAEAVHE